MKNIILILAIISIHLIFDATGFRRECRKETGVSWPPLKKLKAGNFVSDDPKLKCYLRCILLKHNILSQRNEMNLEKALRYLPEEMRDQSRKSFAKCRSNPGKDLCDNVLQVTKCFFKSEPEVLSKVAHYLV